MKSFRFARFVALLVRVLEISVVAALVLRWLDALLGLLGILGRRNWFVLPRAVVDAALNFSFLAIILLVLTTLWLLLTGQPHASAIAIRTGIYIVVFFFTPYRLGSSAVKATLRPNHAVERTATRLVFTPGVARMVLVLSPGALGRRLSPCSR